MSLWPWSWALLGIFLPRKHTAGINQLWKQIFPASPEPQQDQACLRKSKPHTEQGATRECFQTFQAKKEFLNSLYYILSKGHTCGHQLNEEQCQWSSEEDQDVHLPPPTVPQCQPSEEVRWDLNSSWHETADIRVSVKLGGVECQSIISKPQCKPKKMEIQNNFEYLKIQLVAVLLSLYWNF